EYDKPILGNIDNPNMPTILKQLKGFYNVIKTYEGLIRFAFITGVSKFAHVSLFSDLNNLTDVTLNPEYAGMLGFSEAEIRENFADRIPLAAAANGCPEEELMGRLLKWYDGYRFSDDETHVCNPVSVSTFFSNDYKFSNYWGKTGMPSFLLELAKNVRFNFEKAVSIPVSDLVFGAYELDNLDPMGLLWQTGYLTIKEILPGPLGSSMYRLGFPDYEVEQSFNTQLLAYYSGRKDGETAGLVFQLMTLIRENRIEDFMKVLQSYFASIPYDIRGGDEHYYQTIFFITFLLLGGEVEAEARTSDGRIDAVVSTRDHVFIFEFKLDKPSPTALTQIEDKEYYLKYQSSGKAITLVGASFDQGRGILVDWTYFKN
ncbi:MAG: AAA family ATPase, partial [Victivallales bacterium]|nr:AAA family ATPase [Victivallales bacterium]